MTKIKVPSGYLSHGQLYTHHPRKGAPKRIAEAQPVIGHRSRIKAHASGLTDPVDDLPLQEKMTFGQGPVPVHPGMQSKSLYLRGKPRDHRPELMCAARSLDEYSTGDGFARRTSFTKV
ncbi:hypothetical protein QNJ95_42655 [Bradyrhizobium elkanii]|uniref:hypothetical protein n=1 Tax=Bradyrhizobium TaxID=374 RepID=UPI0027120A1A|nr:hypothetical protein [Bradyrhizobium elkanii]WLA39472.1 hypothetical protein QNJ95_42655 [Bradyrhizobium elkanii]